MAVEHSVEISDAPNNDDGKIRTGTVWTCIAHIITGVIGAGVLSLAWSTAQLGWIAGPSTMLCFAVVTYISAFMLSECYRSPHPVNGARNYSYMDAVRRTLGKKHTWFCGFLQYLSLFGTSTAYVITTATCMRAVQRSNCYHKEGHSASCSGKDGFFMLIFGVVQIFFSQIPDFHNMQWLSVAAAVMSFTYSFIGLGLGLAKVMGDGRIKGGIGGIHTASTAQKVWKLSQAIGDVAFAYPYSIIVIEIQDTLKSPPPENQTMKKASMASIIITTFFYLCCGCFGYAAFGDDTPGNLLTGFGFYEPFWLVDLANVCIILHLIGGYQIMSSRHTSSYSSNQEHIVYCQCNLPCKVCITKRAENRGRRFHRCCRFLTRDDCHFFRWIDEVEQSTSSMNNSRLVEFEEVVLCQLEAIRKENWHIKNLLSKMIVVVVPTVFVVLAILFVVFQLR